MTFGATVEEGLESIIGALPMALVDAEARSIVELAKSTLDLVAQVDPPPADGSIDVQIRPLFDRAGELVLLRVASPTH